MVHFHRELELKTPPRSNLGPMSEPWARDITDQVQQNAIAIERMGGDATNDGRINNSTMDTLASQITELQQRQSGIVQAANVSTPSFSTGIQTINVNIQLPRPTDAPRVGWVSVQFTATNSNANQSEVYGSISIDGAVFHRDSRSVPSTNFEPASWGGQKAITGYTGFVASPNSGGLITLVLQAEVAFSTGARVVNFQNIQATYQYGQKV